MMKKILYILSILLFISCSHKNFPTKFFTTDTDNAAYKIDSIIKADTLRMPTDYRKWTKNMFITSDSVIMIQYTAVCQKNDATFIISVTETENKSATIKLRKE